MRRKLSSDAWKLFPAAFAEVFALQRLLCKLPEALSIAGADRPAMGESDSPAEHEAHKRFRLKE